MTSSRSSIALSSIIPRISVQTSLHCLGETRIFRPLAMAVLSGSMPMIEYPYDGILPHFRSVGLFSSQLIVEICQIIVEIDNHSRPYRHTSTGLFSRAELAACTASIGSETVTFYLRLIGFGRTFPFKSILMSEYCQVLTMDYYQIQL
jgi:hypothetical protein